MATESAGASFELVACRELLDAHPESLRIREQVEALEDAMPDRPGIVVSFCRTIIETTCKTILTDRGISVDPAWESPKLVSESLKYLNLGPRDDGTIDAKVKAGAENLVRGLNQIIGGIDGIRNSHGTAAHGQDAYAPLMDGAYAEILARATDAVVGLMFRTHLGIAARGPLARIRYDDHADFNEFIDETFGPFEVLEVSLLASEALHRTDVEAYRAALIQFKQDENGVADDPDEGARNERIRR